MFRRLSIALLAALGACAPAPPRPGPSVGVPPPAPAPEELPAEPEPEPQASDAAAIVVGVLHRHGVHVCDGDAPPDRGRWVDVHPMVGFVPLIVGKQLLESAEPLYGSVVAARGHVREGRPVTLEPGTHECQPGMQMRSDWVWSIEGMRRKRKAPPLPAFGADALERFHGLSAEQSGDSLRVRFENRLGRALRAPVVVRAHYEGCYGKPGTAQVERRAEAGLAAGKLFVAEFPRFDERPDRPESRRRHVISSIEIDATGDRIWFDLDVPVKALGIEASCR